MKKIYDAKRVQSYLEMYNIQNYFDFSYPFFVMEYDKDEMIIHPLKETQTLQFVVQGEVSIYSIDSKGKQVFVSQTNHLIVLGDVEYIRKEKPIYFTQANTKVVVLAVSIQENRCKLDQDIKFLHFLMNSIVNKLEQSASNDIVNQTVEDKVLNYMKYSCKDHVLMNVSTACKNIHCSRRQLQRVLKQLCEKEIVVKRNKGEYVLK